MNGDVGKLGIPIVIDIGTYATKVGFAGERNPREIVRTLVGRDMTTNGWLFGDQVLPAIDHVHLHKPILDGCLIDEVLGDFKRFIEYIITRVLKADPADHPLLLLVNGKGVGIEWDNVALRIYAKLKTPALCILRSGMPCLYALGHATAIIVQVGAGHTTVAPLVNYYGTQRTIPRLYIGAHKDVTTILHRQLVKRGVLPDTLGGLELARQVKEQVCYTSLHFEDELKQAEAGGNRYTKTASLPNGMDIECGIERFLGPEVFFTPKVDNINLDPLDEVIANSTHNTLGFYRLQHGDFRQSDEERKAELASHIVLVGGHVTMPGFTQRIQQGVAARLPGFKVSVTIPEHHDHFEWYGGSLAAEKGKIYWLLKDDWERAGKSYQAATISGFQPGVDRY
jgi:actin-related protein